MAGTTPEVAIEAAAHVRSLVTALDTYEDFCSANGIGEFHPDSGQLQRGGRCALSDIAALRALCLPSVVDGHRGTPDETFAALVASGVTIRFDGLDPHVFFRLNDAVFAAAEESGEYAYTEDIPS